MIRIHQKSATFNRWLRDSRWRVHRKTNLILFEPLSGSTYPSEYDENQIITMQHIRTTIESWENVFYKRVTGSIQNEMLSFHSPTLHLLATSTRFGMKMWMDIIDKTRTSKLTVYLIKSRMLENSDDGMQRRMQVRFRNTQTKLIRLLQPLLCNNSSDRWRAPIIRLISQYLSKVVELELAERATPYILTKNGCWSVTASSSEWVTGWILGYAIHTNPMITHHQSLHNVRALSLSL